MYGCPNCNNVFEPVSYGTRGGEPFIRCPECGMNRALNSEVWGKNAQVADIPEPKLEETLEVVKKVTAKKPATKKSTKKSKKK